MEKNEYLYDVEVASDKLFENKVVTFSTNLKGACFTPALPQGKTYYVRMRAARQWQIITDWSAVYTIYLSKIN